MVWPLRDSLASFLLAVFLGKTSSAPTLGPHRTSAATAADSAAEVPEVGAALGALGSHGPGVARAAGARGMVSAFDTPISAIAWLGSPGNTTAAGKCDAKCRNECILRGGGEVSWHGDAFSQRTDVCLAGCGCAGDGERLVLLTEAGGAYLSPDAGRSWKDLSKILPPVPAGGSAGSEAHRSSALSSADGAGIGGGGGSMGSLSQRLGPVWVSHADPARVVILGEGKAWLSHDGGSSWRLVNSSAKGHGKLRFESWKWHPTMPEWALVEVQAWHGSATKSVLGADAFGTTARDVFVTQDCGASWRPLAMVVEQCHWATRGRSDLRRVLITRREGADAANQLGLLEVLDSNDFMATHSVLVGTSALAGAPRAAMHVTFHSNLIAAVVPDSEGGRSPLTLWLASDNGMRAPIFHAASWPNNIGPLSSKQLKHVEILYSAEHAAMLFVRSRDSSLPWGHLLSYQDGTHPQLELLLTDVHKPSSTSGVSWQAVAGIEGIFLANRAVLERGGDLDRAESRLDEQAAEASEEQAVVEEEEGQQDADKGYTIGGDWGAQKAPPLAVRTYISMNMGLAWQPLSVLEAQSASSHSSEVSSAKTSSQASSRRLDCAGMASSKCSLHLARWTSASAAPGILVGVGNVGMHLSDDAEHHSVFVSRDAGLTWKFVLEGSHAVTILGHGDALVAVPAKAPSSPIYSADGGRVWHEIPIDATSKSEVASTIRGAGVTVNAIFMHPMHTDFKAFAVLGSDASSSVVLVALNLTGVITQACRAPPDASGAIGETDFERWSPADALEDSHASKRPVCLLGARTVYLRRKAGRMCRTGTSSLFMSPIVDTVSKRMRKDSPCACTRADWSCDAGYHRASFAPGAPCEPLEGVSLPNISALCAATNAEEIEVTRGYLKSPGNLCTGGVDLSSAIEPCPSNIGISGAVRRFLEYHTMVMHAVEFGAVAFLIAGFHLRFRGARGGGPDPLSVKLRSYGIPIGKAKEKTDDDMDEEHEFLIQGDA